MTFKVSSGKNRSQIRSISFEEIQRLISSEGKLIIENGHFFIHYLESVALKLRANQKWAIIGFDGLYISEIIPLVVKDDSLIFYRLGERSSINIEDVEEVSIRRNVSVLKWTLFGPLIGWVAGGLISIVADANSSCVEGKDVCFSAAVVFMPLGFILGPGIGYGIGKYRDRDTILDLRGLLQDEKVNILKNEFGFYSSNPS